ncbi:MAG TPA: RNA polymerase sigma factor RpoD/SigA [Thermodesulfobacteriota bacterium]|nr:RNA polymerase sigma factor RpoD/SigA [Thermodesulfobacteriota bacterium]
MLSDTDFDEIFDEYTAGEADYIAQDERIFTAIEPEGGFEMEFNLSVEPSKEVKTPEKKEEIPNRDLRLLKAYFKEIGTEPLLTPTEEIEVTAKIRKCETRAKEIQKTIERSLGKEPRRQTRKTVQELKEIADKGAKTEVSRKRLKRLINLLEAYSSKATQSRNRFIKANLRLVASIAKRYIGRGLPFLDLIQEGNLGLMKAVEGFDHTKGYRFSTYASWWIQQAMTRAIFNQTGTIKVPVYLFEKSAKIREVKKRLREEIGREPLTEEIAKEADMSEDNVKRVLEANEKVVSLDSTIWYGEKTTLIDFVADSSSPQADSLIAMSSLPRSVNNALSILSSRERDVVKRRFGIGFENTSTLDEIGRQFGLTKERIRQIERGALQKLKRSNSAPVLRSLIEVS